MAVSELTDKELTSVRTLSRDSLKSDVRINILSIDKILILEKLKKNKEQYHERYLVICSEPGRLLTIKSKLVGKTISENILIITINEIKHYVHNNEFYCIEIIFNDKLKSIILCTKSIKILNKILINLLSVTFMISQCAIFEPKLINISKEEILDKIDRSSLTSKFVLSNNQILALSYQILCIVENVIIDKNLYELFIDKEFHETNHIFDINYILRHYTSLAIKNKKNKKSSNKYKINPREVLVIIHSLNYVNSFTHLHLDGIIITENIASRLGKLIARNNTIQSIALRKTRINAKTFYILMSVIDKEIIKNNKLIKKMKILDHFTLSHNNLQLINDGSEKKKKNKNNDNDDQHQSFFESMDGNVLCVRKLYISRCNLNRILLSEIIDAVINYKYLEKIDLSFNNFYNDSIITFKLSQFCKKIEILQSLLLKECKLQLTFLQDLINSSYDYRHNLSFLDLSGNIMTHYGAIAIGQILQNTLCSMIKIDLSNIKNMDHSMLESILYGPFRSPFKNIYIQLIFNNCSFDNNEYLKALSNMIRFAQQQKNDCNGIQSIDLSLNNLGNKFDIICESYISNFYCLESINFDHNFKLNKTKKGYYSSSINALCLAIEKLPKLTNVSLRGDWANNLYLTYDDLLPILKFIANTENKCNLLYLCLDGNRIKDDGCKIIANSLKTNNKLKILSIEDNKCSFKGFKYILQSIIECKDIDTIKLCDIPIHSILDDPNFKSKIKKNRDKIEQCIKIIQQNRLNEILEQQQQQQQLDQQQQLQQPGAPPPLQSQQSQVPFLDDNSDNDSGDDDNDDIKQQTEQQEGKTNAKSPGMKYSQATHKFSNVDRLAFMLNTSNMPKLKSIKKPRNYNNNNNNDEEKVPAPPSPPGINNNNITSSKPVKQTKAKIVSSGVEAELNKPTNTNIKNAKSKRKKKTRKKLDI